MAKLTWDQVGERTYETGVDHGVLYLANGQGTYNQGFPWNGLVTVTESPSGAEASPQYADNIKYLNLTSAEEFGGTIEAFTYPSQFAVCDGTAEPTIGVRLSQQSRKSFGLSYRTKIGNDTDGTDFGYKLHLIYNALAAPTEKAYGTINDSPEAITFSWAITTTPVPVTGFKPTAILTIDSTKVDAVKLAQLEDRLYGTGGVDPALPTPDEVIAIFAGSTTVVTPVAPTYVAETHTITVPNVTGIVYQIDGVTQTGDVVIAEDTIVTAKPAAGYAFPAVSDDDWFIAYA